MSTYSSQGIQQWEGEELKKSLKYFTDYLPATATFIYPDKTMEDCGMLSFLRGVLPSFFGVLELKWSF